MKNETYMVNGIEKEILPNYAHLQKWNTMGFVAMFSLLIVFGAVVICYHSQAIDLLWWILPIPIALMCLSFLWMTRLLYHVKCVNCGRVTENVVRNKRNQTLLFYCKNCDTLNDALISRKADD